MGREPTGIRVLVVDDEAGIVRTLLRLLRQRGHVAFGATTLAEATAIADRERLDFAITDWLMPDCSGDDVCAMLRQRRPPPSIAILTGCPDEHLPDRAEEVGAIAFLRKPVDPARLDKLIRRVVRIRRDATSVPPPRSPLTIDRARGEVHVNGTTHRGFSGQHLQLLECLVEHLDHVVPWEQLRIAAECNSVPALRNMLSDVRDLLGERDRKLLETIRRAGVILRAIVPSK